jgi:hypothetical protein
MNRIQVLLSLSALLVLFGCASRTHRVEASQKKADSQPAAADAGSTSSESAAPSDVIVEHTGKGKAIALRLEPPPTESWTYRTRVETRQSGVQSFTLHTELEQAVAAKRTQGGVEIAVTITDVSMKSSEPEFQQQMDEMARMMKGIQTVAVYDARAFTEGAQSTGGSGIPAMIAAAQAGVPVGLFGVMYPDQPVGVGASWTGRYEMRKMIENMARASGTTARILKGSSYPVHYRLDEVRSVRGRRIAVISFTLVGETQTELTVRAMSPSGGAQESRVLSNTWINGKGKAQIDVETGMPIRVEVEQRSTAEAQGTKTETVMKSTTWRES